MIEDSPYRKICPTDENPTAEAAFKDFYDTVRSSPRFQWMGIGELNDEYDRHRVAVYLSEVIVPVQFRRSLTLTFRPWSRAECNNSVFVDLYFMRHPEPKETLKERALMDMAERYHGSTAGRSHRFLWEEYFR